MGHKPPVEESSSDDETSSSDEESQLQEAFAKGLIKPGLNQEIEKVEKSRKNNVADMKLKISEMQLNLPWLETLILISDPAPMAPDVAIQLHETTQRQINIRENNAKLPQIDVADDPILNDFKRETLFHRQAQATVIEGIRRLHDLGIVTKRPEIYFAEMAKSDVHMQKVRKNLMAKQAGQARAEKVRQLRIQKKMGKQLQAQVKQSRAMEKKAVLNEVKKYRKGAAKNNDDLFDNKNNKKGVVKKNFKDKKFGFGGKKRDNKRNTKSSSSDFSELHRKKRPGKSQRIKFKAGGKKTKTKSRK